MSQVTAKNVNCIILLTSVTKKKIMFINLFILGHYLNHLNINIGNKLIYLMYLLVILLFRYLNISVHCAYVFTVHLRLVIVIIKLKYGTRGCFIYIILAPPVFVWPLVEPMGL